LSSHPDWLTRWLSAPRLATFVAAAGGDVDYALALYTWNSRVSAAFLRDLADLEVLVRNAYDSAIVARRHGGQHWLRDSTFVLLRPRLRRNGQDANYRTRKIVADAIKDAGGAAASDGKIVAQLSFGFWRHMTAKTHEHGLWVPYLRNAFVTGASRHEVDSRMASLGLLRNRIAHHEAVLGRDLHKDRGDILEVSGWIDEHVREYIEATSDVSGLLAARPNHRDAS
jgi:hypothetical protein